MANFIKFIDDRDEEIYVNVDLVEYFCPHGHSDEPLITLNFASDSSVLVKSTPDQILTLINANS